MNDLPAGTRVWLAAGITDGLTPAQAAREASVVVIDAISLGCLLTGVCSM
jgi:hypothetical protein